MSAVLGFGGHIFVLYQGTYLAVRVAREFLEWDAPSSGYNILNSRRQFDAGFRVAVIDPDVIGASVPDAEFSPIPVDVRSVNRITLNGTQENLGDGETWRFDVARQKLIQDPNATALTAADALVVDYAARGIAQACNPAAAVMRDAFADLRDSEGLAREDALETAEAVPRPLRDADGSALNRDPGQRRDRPRGPDGAVRYRDAPRPRAHRCGRRRPVADLRRAVPVVRRRAAPAGRVPARGIPGAGPLTGGASGKATHKGDPADTLPVEAGRRVASDLHGPPSKKLRRPHSPTHD